MAIPYARIIDVWIHLLALLLDRSLALKHDVKTQKICEWNVILLFCEREQLSVLWAFLRLLTLAAPFAIGLTDTDTTTVRCGYIRIDLMWYLVVLDVPRVTDM